MSLLSQATSRFLLLMPLCGGIALAGTLSVGNPEISGNQYTFPIVLDSNSSDVAVMDFHFQYDPQVFNPVEAQAGAQADYSNKIVNANQASPGEYIVVLWGPNQNTLKSGEVARITMEYTGAETPNTSLGISGLTMANADGAAVASQARNLDVEFGNPTEPPGSEKPETPPAPPANKPESPAEGNTGSPGNPAIAVGSPGVTMEDEQKITKKRDDKKTPQDTDPTISHITKNSQGMTDRKRLAELAQNAQSLRDTLPTPETPNTQNSPQQKAKLDVPGKNDIISPSLGAKADAGNGAARKDAAITQLARAGGVEAAKDVTSSGAQIFGAESQSLRSVLLLGCGGVFVGLVLFLSLRKKFFA